jgi:hypothetical protein
MEILYCCIWFILSLPGIPFVYCLAWIRYKTGLSYYGDHIWYTILAPLVGILGWIALMIWVFPWLYHHLKITLV